MVRTRNLSLIIPCPHLILPLSLDSKSVCVWILNGERKNTSVWNFGNWPTDFQGNFGINGVQVIFVMVEQNKPLLGLDILSQIILYSAEGYEGQGFVCSQHWKTTLENRQPGLFYLIPPVPHSQTWQMSAFFCP